MTQNGSGGKNDNVLYVYDRICPKDSKKKQILKEYGKTSAASDVRNYTYGKDFAHRQRERARIYAEAHPYANARRNASSQRASSQAYNYRPGAQTNGSGEVRTKTNRAESERPLKIIIEHIINLFDTIEERGKADENIAKQHAIIKKRLYDHRNTILTAFLVLLVTLAFVFISYKLVFVIDSVDVSGSDIYSNEEIVFSSGIGVGDNLYSFDKTEAEADITFRCPYIKSAEITRTVPKSVSVVLEEDSELYFANIWGEYVILSPSLRVLDTIDRDTAKANGLIELVLPPVSYSVEGRAVKFISARDERFIRSVLEEVVNSELYANGLLDKVDLTDEYGITMQAGSKYLLKFGNETDCDLKLRMAYRAITDVTNENNSPARVDLTVVGEASIMFDMQLSLD